MRCTMGEKTAKLTVLPSRTVYLTGQPMANISDHISMVNLAPFGKCRSLGYPATASATAAHHGHLTPMPCVHNTPNDWMQGKSDYIVKGKPALLKSCRLRCMWGGVITMVNDGQVGEGVRYVQKNNKTTVQELQEQSNIDKGLTVDSVLDGLQTVLDLAGFVPGVGAVPDLTNAAIYALRGDKVNASLSLLAAVPGVGDVAAGGKLVGKAMKTVKTAENTTLVAAKSGGKIVSSAEKTATKSGQNTVKEARHVTGTKAGHGVNGIINGEASTGKGQPFLSVTRRDKILENGNQYRVNEVGKVTGTKELSTKAGCGEYSTANGQHRLSEITNKETMPQKSGFDDLNPGDKFKIKERESLEYIENTSQPNNPFKNYKTPEPPTSTEMVRTKVVEPDLDNGVTKLNIEHKLNSDLPKDTPEVGHVNKILKGDKAVEEYTKKIEVTKNFDVEI